MGFYKYIIFYILFLLFITQPGFAQDNSFELAPDEKTWIEGHQDIRVGFPTSQEPIAYINDQGETVGILSDYLDLLNEYSGLNITIEFDTYDEINRKVQNKNLDGNMSIYSGAESIPGMTLTNTYLKVYPTFYSLTDQQEDYQDLSRIENKTVAIQIGDSFAEQILKPYKDKLTIVYVSTVLEGLTKVFEGKVDSLLALSIDNYLISKHMLIGIKPANVLSDHPVNLMMGLRSDFPELITILNKFIKATTQTEINYIITRWISIDISDYTGQFQGEKKVSLSESQRLWLDDQQEIVLGFTEGYEPLFIQSADGEYSGILVDLVNELNNRLDTDIKLISGEWAKMLKQTEIREIDGVLAIHPDNADARGLLKSRNHITAYPALFSKADVYILTEDDLADKTIAYAESVNFAEEIIDLYGKKSTVIRAKNPLEAMQMVYEGKADVMIGLTSNTYLISKYYLSNVTPSFIFWNKQVNTVFGINSGQPELVEILNKGLDSFSENEFDQIIRNWVDFYQKPADIVFSDRENRWLEENPTISLGIDSQFEPFSFINENGDIDGMNHEIIHLIEKKIGIEILMESGPWPDILKQAMDHELDGIINADKTEEREKQLNYTRSFSHHPVALFVHNDSPLPSDLESLNELRIAVKKNTSVYTLLKNIYPEIDLVKTSGHEEGLLMLSRKEVDGVLDWSAVLQNSINRLVIEDVTLAFTHLSPEIGRSRIALKNSSPELVSIMDKAIRAFTYDEKLMIWEKWLGQSGVELLKELEINLNLTLEEQSWLDASPVIRVAVDQSWEPVEFRDKNGIYQGISIDYLNLIESRTGLKLKIVEEDWQTLNALAVNGEIDMFTSFAKTPERSVYLNFTTPYLNMPIGIFGGRGITYIGDLSELNGKKVAVVEGYAIQEILERNHQDFDLVLVRDIKSGVQSVLKGEAVVFIGNILTTSQLIGNMGYTNVRVVGETPYANSQAMAVRKNWPLLNNILQKALDSISESERKSIYKKWVSISYELGFDYTILWRILAIVLALTVFFLFWTRRLNHLVKERTKTLSVLNLQYKDAQEIARLGYWKQDLSSDKIFISDETCKIFEFENRTGNVTYDFFLDRVHLEDREMVKKAQKELEISYAESDINYRLQLKDDRIKYIHDKGHANFDKGGNLLHFSGTLQDISEKKQKELELAKLAAAIEQSNDNIIITDPDCHIEYVNQACEELTGYKSAEVLGKKSCFLCSGDDDRKLCDELLQTVRRKQAWKGQLISKSKDGEIIQESAIIFPVLSSSGEIVNIVEIRRNISDQLKMEQQLRQAQKMEAMGTLAGGIAHDFNNILSGLFGFIQLSKRNKENPEKLEKYLNELFQGSMRAADLVKQILTFSRKTEEDKLPLKTFSIVKEALKLIKSSIPSTISIKQNINSKGTILADATQIHQVIMNLCTNAYHAMKEDRGDLSVTLTDMEIEDKNVVPGIDIPIGEYQLLEVSDNGSGMDYDTLGKIFEPYFTTKKTGEGTGLGLAVVHGIIKSHNGYITVESEPGVGTTFKIYFPLLKEENIKKPAEIEVDNDISGNASILIVDDEVKITESLQEFLEDYGFSVTTYNDPALAYREIKNRLKEFDLLITDMTMPNMTGFELIEKLKQLKPELPIILSSGSGFGGKIDRAKLTESGIDTYLEKPLQPDNLLNEINEILNKKDIKNNQNLHL